MHTHTATEQTEKYLSQNKKQKTKQNKNQQRQQQTNNKNLAQYSQFVQSASHLF